MCLDNQFDDDSYIKYTDIIINLISIVIYLSYNLAKSKILEKNEILEKENLEIESKVHALPEIQTKIESTGAGQRRRAADPHLFRPRRAVYRAGLLAQAV